MSSKVCADLCHIAVPAPAPWGGWKELADVDKQHQEVQHLWEHGRACH